MRFFLFVLLLVTFSYFPVFAQQSQEMTKAPQSDEFLMEDPTPEQLKEARSFLNECYLNDVLNERHNCKCLSLQLLEKRVQSGNTARTSEILSSLRNTCLKNQDEANEELGYKDMSDVSDEAIEEAQYVYNECMGNWAMSTYHDCKCIAGKFMTDREKKGPLVSYDSIIASYQNDCKNEVDLAGFKYSNCMDNHKLMVPSDFKTSMIKPFCECYAREYVKINSALSTKPDAGTESNLMSSASSICELNMRRK